MAGTIHVHDSELAERHGLAALGRAHHVDIAQDLFPHLQQPAPYDHGVAGHQLALVGDVLLHGGHAVAPLTKIGRRQAQFGEQVPGGLVEFADVPHDVHVAHLVTMPLHDGAAVGIDEV